MLPGEKKGREGMSAGNALRYAGRLTALLVLGAALLLPAAAQRPYPPRREEEESPRRPSKVELRKHNYEEMKKDAAAMVKAAEELRKGVEKPGSLPTSLISSQAAEIEKYAKRIQAKMRAVY